MATASCLAALLPAGCGGGDAAAGEAPRRPDLTVSAAASLKAAMSEYAEEFSGARVRLSFAGSDELAAQIRQGAAPDVFAAADTSLPEQLHRAGLTEAPVVFAGNELVVAVPARGARTDVASLDDLAEPGVTLAIGAPTSPVGAYARTVLDRLPSRQRDAILRNVRSTEPDVGGVVGKLSQGSVDAGFVYATDVKGAGGTTLRAIELPERLQPSVSYAVAVVREAREPAAARRFVDGLVGGAGQDALRAAGFRAPP